MSALPEPRWPRPVTEGEVVLIAPAGRFDPADMAPGLALLDELGRPWRMLAAPDEADGALAAPDATRAARLGQAMDSPGTGLAWALRGGYGCVRLLRGLDAPALAERDTALMGLSDLTVLLNVIAARAGLITLHGPVVRSVGGLDEESRVALRGWLGEGRLPRRHGLDWIRGDSARGRLFGGNLATLVSLLGTPFFGLPEGALLFVEDVNEAPYRVDRMFQSLSLSGALDRVSGVILGEFLVDGRPISPRLDWLVELSERHGFSLARGLACGHGARNTVLPVGAPAVLGRGGAALEIEAPR
jgi:muramoyltetrapeptide carboxypeptidase